MISTTFYLSRIIGRRLQDTKAKTIGRITDVLVISRPAAISEDEQFRPKVIGLKIKVNKQTKFVDFASCNISKKGKYTVICSQLNELSPEIADDCLLLGESIQDKQIVDINGKKVVRVNDVRLVTIPSGTYALAVDVGIEGLLRRIGINAPIKALLSLFGVGVPSKFILWDSVEAIDVKNLSIQLSTSSSKLNTLHPSDLADIIEELGKESKTKVFSSLNEEHAADVLEELEVHSQIHIIESLPIEKAADVLEKMPADEVADILDELSTDKAESLLNEMETEASDEVRELLEYHRNEVGSLMSTEFLSFQENNTVEDVLRELRIHKPETETVYNLFVTDHEEHLIAYISFRDLLVSQPDVVLNKIMKKNPVSVMDDDRVDSLAEIVEKYNMLAIPVIDAEKKLQGMVVIDDIVEDLIHKGRTK